MNNFLASRPLAAALLASLLLLAGCGGGGGGDDAPAPLGPPPSTRFGSSYNYANVCTLDGQRQFLRAYMDEVYLWYDRVPEVNAAQYTDIGQYFDALLVPEDIHSTAIPNPSNRALAQSLAAARAPLDLLSSHTGYVPQAKVVTSAGGRRVGYIEFIDHAYGAQDDLIVAFQQVRSGQAQDLVLDLRRNSGGYLYVALAAASMVTGPASQGQVFEQLRYSDKRAAETAASTLRYSGQVQYAETQNPVGTQLPQLGLPRLYVLTSKLTASSSESIINGLRGIDMQVILVGDRTYGKPYGFRERDNCGYAFFPVEFQGFNAKGFGDYTAGFQPTCAVADAPNQPRGSATDPVFAAALVHVDSGACPPGTANPPQAGILPKTETAQPSRPAWAGRLLLPQ